MTHGIGGLTSWTARASTAPVTTNNAGFAATTSWDHCLHTLGVAGGEPSDVDDVLTVLIARLAHALEELVPDDHGPSGDRTD
jgi:hypothetical protein